jgi:hypothetical protein
MNRRAFAKLSGGGLMLPFLDFDFSGKDSQDDIQLLIQQLIEINDARIPSALEKQEKDKDHKWYGGVPNDAEIFMAGYAAGFIRNLTCSYVSDLSKYHISEELVSAILLSSEYLLNAQYDDGNIDLPTTNFHSPPDTAFVVEPLCIAYGLLKALDDPALEILLGNLKKFLLKAGDAMTVGGIHTANHRWVVCMALARINHLFPNQKYLERIDQWLAEKIDIDPEGQYAEKSTLIYTPLVNRCLITIARLVDKPDLFDPVRKNLDMTLYYIHPNGEIATESSGRQDRYQRGTMQRYFYPYRYMAILDQNGQFAAMTEEIRNLEPEKLLVWLAYLLEDPNLSGELPTPRPIPKNYIKEFYRSDLVRIRRGNVDATLLFKNPIFLTFFKGNAALESVRLASAFFGKGQFKAQTFERSGDGYILKQKLVGPYYQPLEEEDIPEDGNGWQVSRMKRAQSEVQKQETVVTISERDGEVSLYISISGTDNVPVAMEMAFRHGGRFEGVTEVEGIENAWLAIPGKMMKYTFGEEIISFGPGIREHAWTQLRGALPKLDADCVYITGFTPFNITIKIN